MSTFYERARDWVYKIVNKVIECARDLYNGVKRSLRTAKEWLKRQYQNMSEAFFSYFRRRDVQNELTNANQNIQSAAFEKLLEVQVDTHEFMRNQMKKLDQVFEMELKDSIDDSGVSSPPDVVIDPIVGQAEVMNEEIVNEEGVYVGSSQDGLKHGSGKMTWTDGRVYDGQWINGKRNGLGKQTWRNGDEYYGGWVDDKRQVYGLYTWANNDTYKGKWLDGQFHGKGKQIQLQAKYYELNSQTLNGQVSYTARDGGDYEGEWVQGKKQGSGIFQLKNGDKYDGEWLNDKKHGQGTFTCLDNSRYIGQWQNDKRHGQGKYTYNDGRVEQGVWVNDAFTQ